MHAIEEAKGCMQKGKDFNRLQAKGDTIFRGEIIFGEKPFLGRSPFWGEAIFWRHIPVKYVMRHFLKHVGLGINKRLFQERSHILVLYVKDISM